MEGRKQPGVSFLTGPLDSSSFPITWPAKGDLSIIPHKRKLVNLFLKASKDSHRMALLWLFFPGSNSIHSHHPSLPFWDFTWFTEWPECIGSVSFIHWGKKPPISLSVWWAESLIYSVWTATYQTQNKSICPTPFSQRIQVFQ